MPHGFRSSFRDWAAERTSTPREVVEAALAHRVQNPTEAAYARSDLFERRRRLMDDWASALGTLLAAARVVEVVVGRKHELPGGGGTVTRRLGGLACGLGRACEVVAAELAERARRGEEIASLRTGRGGAR